MGVFKSRQDYKVCFTVGWRAFLSTENLAKEVMEHQEDKHSQILA